MGRNLDEFGQNLVDIAPYFSETGRAWSIRVFVEFRAFSNVCGFRGCAVSPDPDLGEDGPSAMAGRAGSRHDTTKPLLMGKHVFSLRRERLCYEHKSAETDSDW